MSTCVVCRLEVFRFERTGGRCALPMAVFGKPFPADVTVFGTEVCAMHGERLVALVAPGVMTGDPKEVTYR